MNRTEVLEQMAPLTDLRVREVEHTPRTRVMVTPEAVLIRPTQSGRFLPMAVEGIRDMAKFSGFPQDLAMELSPDTFGRVATELLARKGRYSLLLRQDMVVGFARAGLYRPLDPERVLRTVEQGIGETDFQRVHVAPDRSVSVEVIGQNEGAVTKGDLVRGGAMVAWSPIGVVDPLVQSYVVRLVCTNGATSTDMVSQYHYGGDGDDVWQWFRESARNAYRSMNKVIDRWRQMRAVPIPAADRAMVLEAMLKKAGIRTEVAEAVRARALAEPPRTPYDIMNLITWASSHLLEAPAEVRRAQQAAASFAEETEHRRICPVCHRAN